MPSNRTCDLADCNRRVLARGYCSLHYQRVLAAGLIPPRPDPIERFLSKIDMPTDPVGCWMWNAGYFRSSGYGQFWLFGVGELAHRVSYMLFNGDIPEGMETDHLCRVRLCVNPDHLEAVTRRVNVLRSNSPIAHNARKTHCPRGHAYDYFLHGKRYCKACALIRNRQRPKKKPS